MKLDMVNCGYSVLSSETFNQAIKNTLSQIKKTEVLSMIERCSNPEDVFRTESSEVKQIQNLHKNWLFCDFFKYCSSTLCDALEINGELINSQFFMKPSGYKITSPHQDGAYFNSPDSQIITCWIPLQDVDETNSCMWYYPKKISSILEHKEKGNVIRNRSGSVGKSLYYDDILLDEYIPVPMKKFEVLVHDQYTLHYSSTNNTNNKRISLTFIFKIK